jgi:hypothetical protein
MAIAGTTDMADMEDMADMASYNARAFFLPPEAHRQCPTRPKARFASKVQVESSRLGSSPAQSI